MKNRLEDEKKRAITDEKVRRVVDAMALEGLPLTEEMVEILYDCFNGKTTFEQARYRLIADTKRGFNYGRK